MQTIIIATRNPEKLTEIKAIFSGIPIRIETLLDFSSIPDVLEDGKTLEENALKKAREIFCATQIPSLADDTGLEVYYLDMAPGVLSARYAGETVSYADNNRKLLKELEGVPQEKRGARFRTVAAFVAEDYKKTTEGICKGRISDVAKGWGGFGYDPLFIPDGYDITYAEMSADQKNSISHRGMAFRQMIKVLTEFTTGENR